MTTPSQSESDIKTNSESRPNSRPNSRPKSTKPGNDGQSESDAKTNSESRPNSRPNSRPKSTKPGNDGQSESDTKTNSESRPNSRPKSTKDGNDAPFPPPQLLDNHDEHEQRPVWTQEQLKERAKNRAATRAAQKEERAKQVGLILPTPKPELRDGWAILRDKLRRGVLLREIIEIQAEYDVSLYNNPGLNPKKKLTPALTLIEQDARKSMEFKTEEKIAAIDQKLAKIRQKKKQEERDERRKLLKKRENVERELEYLNFPTILGWYFDGFFTPRFQLNQTYADHFNKLEIKLSEKKEKSIKETFPEKAKRYFWPPEILGGMFFRSRGIYLDFKDIMKDPPHTPTDIVLGQRPYGEELKRLLEGVLADIDLEDPDGNGNDDKNTRNMKIRWSEQLERQLMITDPDAAIAFAEERTKRKIAAIERNPKLKPKQKEELKRKLLKELQKKKDKIRLEKQRQQNRRNRKKRKQKRFFYINRLP